MSWSWYTGELPYTAGCSKCGQRLRLEAGSIVLYKGEKFHVGCLLDKLTGASSEAPAVDAVLSPSAILGGLWP